MSAQINLTDISVLLKAVEVAINKKVYSKQEIDVFFPVWNNLLASVDKINRTNVLNQLYKEEIEEKAN